MKTHVTPRGIILEAENAKEEKQLVKMKIEMGDHGLNFTRFPKLSYPFGAVMIKPE